MAVPFIHSVQRCSVARVHGSVFTYLLTSLQPGNDRQDFSPWLVVAEDHRNINTDKRYYITTSLVKYQRMNGILQTCLTMFIKACTKHRVGDQLHGST